nr:hypothetical protein [Bacteroidales bacterium]
MDVLIGAVFVIGMILLFAAISDAKQKKEMKELEKVMAEKRKIEEKRQEELRKQEEKRKELERQKEEERKEVWRKLEEQRQAEKRYYEEKKKEEQRQFEEKVNNARDNDPANFFWLLLSSKYQINTIYSNDILGIEANLPSKDTVRQINKYNYLKNDGTIKVQLDRDLPKLYEKHLYTLCLNTIHDAFALDTTRLAKSIVYNGFVEDYSPRTGQLERNLILS